MVFDDFDFVEFGGRILRWLSMLSKCEIMDFFKFLWILGKGGGCFEWVGSVKDFDNFFLVLGYVGIWS